MSKKHDFDKLTDDLNKKLKAIEDKKLIDAKRIERLKKAEKPEPVREEFLSPNHDGVGKKKKVLESEETKEKFWTLVGIFFAGHLVMSPFYYKFPQYAGGIFVVASFSICTFCFAVLDYWDD